LGAPDFVYLVLGEKWMPMVPTFRLMIFYVLFDSLVVIGASLAQAVGHPEFWTRARVVQVVFFVPTVILGSLMWQINGVALATDLALLIGLVLLFFQNRRLVDVSLRCLFGFPTLALLLGAGIGWQVSANLVVESHLINGILTVLAFVSIYSMVLLLTEFRTYAYYARMAFRLLTDHAATYDE
jgi:O-antigen/teichoic acid export membrane protein